jgi:hypothetical protein
VGHKPSGYAKRPRRVTGPLVVACLGDDFFE